MSSIKEFAHLKISLEAIKLATNNFGDSCYISEGGFGKVYKGELFHFGDQVMVAAKRLDSRFGQGTPEFWKEIMMLSRYRHENLVNLLGFCDEGGENILVYEYLPNQSLDKYLSSSNLSWIQRLNICIGAACGLEYLQNPDETTQRVLHRDIKSSNILLDKSWNAKISDFGLSKLGPANQEFTFVITHAVGTPGYCDPLYGDTGFLTKESDVYSFGVVLFEVLCGRLCVANCDDNHRFLSKLAQSCYEEKKLQTVVLDCLQEQIYPDCLEMFSKIAYQCLHKDHNERPLVAEIVKQLKDALKCQVEYMVEKEKKFIFYTAFYAEVNMHMHDELEQVSSNYEEDMDMQIIQHNDMSEEELKAYDGTDPRKPVLLAIKGQIYDVSSARMFYGAGGTYGEWSGKDASRAIAKFSFEEEDLNRDLTGLGKVELEALDDWDIMFRSKYVKVGSIENPKKNLPAWIYKKFKEKSHYYKKSHRTRHIAPAMECIFQGLCWLHM
ncbi:probable serine/threonine-protein kinase PBL25 [Lactuca sativa]|uniref:Protein kinase domain-containing protein n=1 Tax=Lactuca sativa TaxID=4236 RepID=A0A9R1XXH9_LACSA|nr:probable serine/threonine-protein kinase PBL25 [Lactuca sativa]KAJ0227344.1 hypothetical protein LSAT_V11C100018790 [Lactuca sativa]